MWCLVQYFVFFFKQKTAYEMRISDWSSDVCSSDLLIGQAGATREILVVGLARLDRVRDIEEGRQELERLEAGERVGADAVGQEDRRIRRGIGRRQRIDASADEKIAAEARRGVCVERKTRAEGGWWEKRRGGER